MPLFFSNFAAIWLLPAIVLPIVFHLFFRLRRQVREFPSLMFFLRIDPRLSAKRKIHEWLILLLRCLFLALLIFALLRPILGTRSSGENIARLILIDNSGSMAASATGGLTKLTLAARATDALLTAAHPGDSTAVQLMLPDPTSTLPEKFDAAPAAVRDALGNLAPSDGAAPVAKAIRAALATLDTAKQPLRELHILTDLQKTNWSRGELGPEATNCRIIVHRIESAPLTAGSVSLAVADAPARAIPAGRITPVHFILQNVSATSAHVRMNSADDSGRNSSSDVEISAGGSLPETLTFSFPTPGFHWAQVWLEGNAAPSASRAGLGFFCSDVRKAIFAGNKSDFGALPFAIAPGGNADLSGIEADFVEANQLDTVLATKPLAVALTWNAIPSGGSLQDYVRQGGTLFLLPAAVSSASIAKSPPSWLGASPGVLNKPAGPEPTVLLRPGDEIWQDLLDSAGQPQLGALRVFQYVPIQTGPEWQTLIASARGAPLLARRPLDRGQVIASGLAFTPKWSSLPLKAGFVVLMQNAVFGAQAEHLPLQAIRAGEDFHFDSPNAQASVKSLAGAALDWQGLARDFPGFPRAGVYAITQRDRASWLAVSADAGEADPHFLPLGPVPLLHNLPHDVVPLVHAEDITRIGASQASGAPLYRWLLLVALLLLLAETWLANERSSDLGRNLFASLLPNTAKRTDKKPAKELARV
ncbi:MAG TPA: BatA domain-containing protein [Candidatus Methylacidiphilales bacterium]|jgi:hypothetical protein|nr:BatA domain-containing protein [Candidatus Methylacidiphilales bacterium]